MNKKLYACSNTEIQCAYRSNGRCYYDSPYGRCCWNSGGQGIGMPRPIIKSKPKPELWKCQYCDSMVKRKRTKCPNCGAPKKERVTVHNGNR